MQITTCIYGLKRKRKLICIGSFLHHIFPIPINFNKSNWIICVTSFPIPILMTILISISNLRTFKACVCQQLIAIADFPFMNAISAIQSIRRQTKQFAQKKGFVRVIESKLNFGFCSHKLVRAFDQTSFSLTDACCISS